MILDLDRAAWMLLKLRDSTSSNSASGNAVNNFARFLSLLLIFILVLAMTYYTTRIVAKSQKGLGHSGNMQLLESMPLGGGKILQLVRAGKHYLVLAVGKDSVTKIAELEADEVLPVTEGGGGGSFADILRRMKGMQSPDPDKGTDEHEE